MRIAELFGIGQARLRRWHRQARETGSVAPVADYPRAPYPKMEPANLLVLEELMRETPDATNAELASTRVPTSRMATSS
ncbi:MAG: hypothetical protein RLZZ383_362 [Pseudomonadota bacterium]